MPLPQPTRLLLPLFALLLVPGGLHAAARKSAGRYFRHDVPLRPAEGLEISGAAPAPSTSIVRQFDLQPAGFTPYDRYLSTVRGVLSQADGRAPTITDACRALQVAHGFRYVTRDPYRADPPAVTASRKAGDCKAKALWLYDRLGDSSAMYVIGKVSSRAKAAHAWLYWRWQGRWWILDPTNQNAPIAADTVGRNRYVPYYSYTRTGSYRHPATHLFNVAATGGLSSVGERLARP